jgi:hypothetical protein
MRASSGMIPYFCQTSRHLLVGGTSQRSAGGVREAETLGPPPDQVLRAHGARRQFAMHCGRFGGPVEVSMPVRA